MYYIGIDIGGLTDKGIIINQRGEALASGTIATGVEGGEKAIINNIVELIEGMCKRANVDVNECVLGVGCAGIIDSVNGVIVFSGNLDLSNYPLAQVLKEKLGISVKVTNDANAAALGEAKFGAGKEYADSILVTLGKGVGAGIIIGGKLFEGFKSAGAEVGHMVIERHGNFCNCGRRGCWETYSSAPALVAKTKYAMEEDPSSQMWFTYTSQTCNGKTAFDYMDTDQSAKEVVDWYIDYLACGLINLANAFRPEVIMLGGGISAEGERLTKPLQQKIDKEIMGGTDFAPVKVVTASLGNMAGAYGAAALFI